MMMGRFCLCLGCFILISTVYTTNSSDTDQGSAEQRLLGKLFDRGGYNPRVRPVNDSRQTVNVSVMFSLMAIKDLDLRSQVLTTIGFVTLEWMDERLTWNKEDYDGLGEIIMDSEKLWLPEFAVVNGDGSMYGDYSRFGVVIHNNGLLHWEPTGTFMTGCPLDVTYYPFDEQYCSITLGTLTHWTSKVNLTTHASTVNLDSYESNGELELIHTTAERMAFSYECCPDQKYSNIQFTLGLRRRHTYYVVNAIFPCVLTTVLLLSIFFISSKDKMLVGVLVLLSFQVYLLMVADKIPKTSSHIPVISIYLMSMMCITILALVITVALHNLQHLQRPVPNVVNKVVMGCLATVLCMQTRSRQGHDEMELSQRDEKDNKSRYTRDWTRVAHVVQRFLFCCLLLAVFIVTIMLFKPLTRSKSH